MMALYLLIVLCICIFPVMLMMDYSFASSNNLVIVGDHLGLSVTPSDSKLFDITNMYPGKEGVSTVTVENQGPAPFSLSITASKQGGDDILFDGLDIAVTEENGFSHYSGRMSGLNNLRIDKIFPAGKSEKYNFIVSFPEDSGNELQGKTLSVSFTFAAKSEFSQGSSSGMSYITASVPGKGTLSVYKFYDADKNGIWDEGEEEIEGWVVYINGEEYSTPVILELQPGEYTITEELVEGWAASTPVEYIVTLKEGENNSVSFGNFRDDVEEEKEKEIVIPPDGPELHPDDEVIIDLELPKTGEFPPVIYYVIGLLLGLTGIKLGKYMSNINRI